MDLHTTQKGDRVALIAGPKWVGTVTRVIDPEGAIDGLVEVRWDHQRRVSRSAGFQAGRDLRRA